MMTLQQALALDDLAEVNWGELAADLLSPAQQDVYESIRIPAWEAYQERVAHYAGYHWQIAELVMPTVYKNYMRATAQAFKQAANQEDESDYYAEPPGFDSPRDYSVGAGEFETM